ncbi:MAG: hypothetical protein ACD_48C00235G0002 [uncultured bacterium]|nr:MAG: hypothetical protein ACD_48C00235G0002 [uncultured bacterium]
MNLITVDIAGFRGKLSDYLTLVSMGKAVVSVVNGKSGKEVARLVSTVSSKEEIEARMNELTSLYGFASKTPRASRDIFRKMSLLEIKRIKKGTVI